MPSVSTKWLDAIRISTHVKLQYNVEYITDMIRAVLKPFTDFPRNLNALTSTSGSSKVDIKISPDTGIKVNTTSSIQELPELIGQLYRPDIAPLVPVDEAEKKLTSLLGVLDVSADRRSQLSQALSHSNIPDT